MSTRIAEGWQCDHGARYFTASHPDFRAEVTRWQHAGVAGVWRPRFPVTGEQRSSDADQTLEKFVGVPRMTAPARLLCEGLALMPATTVQQIECRTDGWHLMSAEHGWLDTAYEQVLLALPAPQAMALLQNPAPALAAIAGAVKMRGCWTLMLRYAAALALPFEAAVVPDGPLRWVAHDSSKPGRTGAESWVLQASPDWSEAHLEQDGAWVAEVLLEAFSQLGATPPQAWTAHRWRYADIAQPLGRGCVWDTGRGLGVCGDWLNDGTVQGAWLSGRDLAQQILQSGET